MGTCPVGLKLRGLCCAQRKGGGKDTIVDIWMIILILLRGTSAHSVRDLQVDDASCTHSFIGLYLLIENDLCLLLHLPLSSACSLFLCCYDGSTFWSVILTLDGREQCMEGIGFTYSYSSQRKAEMIAGAKPWRYFSLF